MLCAKNFISSLCEWKRKQTEFLSLIYEKLFYVWVGSHVSKEQKKRKRLKGKIERCEKWVKEGVRMWRECEWIEGEETNHNFHLRRKKRNKFMSCPCWSTPITTHENSFDFSFHRFDFFSDFWQHSSSVVIFFCYTTTSTTKGLIFMMKFLFALSDRFDHRH